MITVARVQITESFGSTTTSIRDFSVKYLLLQTCYHPFCGTAHFYNTVEPKLYFYDFEWALSRYLTEESRSRIRTYNILNLQLSNKEMDELFPGP